MIHDLLPVLVSVAVAFILFGVVVLSLWVLADCARELVSHLRWRRLRRRRQRDGALRR